MCMYIGDQRTSDNPPIMASIDKDLVKRATRPRELTENNVMKNVASWCTISTLYKVKYGFPSALLKGHLEKSTEGSFCKHLGLQHSMTWQLSLPQIRSFYTTQQQQSELGLHEGSRIGVFCDEFVERLHVSALPHILVSGKSPSLSQYHFLKQFQFTRKKAISWTRCMRKRYYFLSFWTKLICQIFLLKLKLFYFILN